MNRDYERPEQIESEIAHTRAELNSTLDAIQSRITPGQLMDQAIDYFRHSLPHDFGANLGQAVRQNPIPVTLVGIGIAWLMASGRHREVRASHGGLGASAADAAAAARESAGAMGERVRDTAAGARARMQALGGSARDGYDRARSGFSRIADEQPLVLGALGLALGAVLGAGLPPTRREDAVMGGTRDELLDAAAVRARDEMHAARESAQRTQPQAGTQAPAQPQPHRSSAAPAQQQAANQAAPPGMEAPPPRSSAPGAR